MTADLFLLSLINVSLGLSAAFFHWRAVTIFSRRKSKMIYIHILAMLVGAAVAVMYFFLMLGMWGAGPVPASIARPVVTGLIATQAGWGFVTLSILGDK